jgi:hypothetical protein
VSTQPRDPFRLLPDALHLVYAFLAGRSELTALVGDRIYTVMPGERRYPLLWISQVGSNPITVRPWWGERTDVQLAAYGTTDRTARTVCDTARSLCVTQLVGDHAEGVVSWVDTLNLTAQPDDALVASTGRALPRWVTTVTVTCHPYPVPVS